MSGPSDLIAAATAALMTEALAEIHQLLLDLLQVPGELFCVHCENVAGPTRQVRVSLQLSQRGADLLGALGAGNVDLEAVKRLLRHEILSCGLEPGEKGESPGESNPAAPATDPTAPEAQA